MGRVCRIAAKRLFRSYRVPRKVVCSFEADVCEAREGKYAAPDRIGSTGAKTAELLFIR
jgi:hypothetical protein